MKGTWAREHFFQRLEGADALSNVKYATEISLSLQILKIRSRGDI